MTEGARRRLGRYISQRRRALRMTAADAARLAELNPKTWEAVEKGTRNTRDSNYAGIEHALRWKPGSIEAILDGFEPTALAEVPEGHRPNAPQPDPVVGHLRNDLEHTIMGRDALRLETRRGAILFIRAAEEAAADELAEQPRRAAG